MEKSANSQNSDGSVGKDDFYDMGNKILENRLYFAVLRYGIYQKIFEF